jgi:hypothetical protein
MNSCGSEAGDTISILNYLKSAITLLIIDFASGDIS